MRVRTVSSSLGLVGGLLWVVGAVLGWGDDPVADTADLLWLVGFGLLVLTGGLAGYALVATAPLWLRVVVTVCSAALVGVVATSLAPDLEIASTPLLVAGAVVLLGSLAGLAAARKVA